MSVNVLLSYEHYVLVTDSVVLGVGEFFATDYIDQDCMKLNTFLKEISLVVLLYIIFQIPE